MDSQKFLRGASIRYDFTRVGEPPEVKTNVITNIKLINDNDCNSRLKYKLIKLLEDMANKLEII